MELAPLDEPCLLSRTSLETPQLHRLAEGSVGMFTLAAPGTALDANEDSAGILPVDDSSAVLIVADGAGGMPAGEEASALAVQMVVEAVRDASHDNLRSAVLDGFERANKAILALGIGAGTTLTVVAIRDGQIRPVHVGDSLILLTGQRGRIKFQSLAHSPVGYGLEAGLLDEDEAASHGERHVVSNLVGTAEMHITVGPRLKLAPRDTLLLASDGLSDNLSIDQIVGCARTGPIPQVMKDLTRMTSQRMLEGAGGHQDDLTLIVFRPSP